MNNIFLRRDSMQLIITEKPSVAQSIAAVLGVNKLSLHPPTHTRKQCVKSRSSIMTF